MLRWHTRLPVAAPERVSEALAAALTQGHDKTVYVALHANHPRELTAQARAACARLIAAGVAMVSQTVLLKGVNDDVGVLEALMRGFVEMRVKPYYLHHPDLAPGTSHLRPTLAQGQALMRELRRRVSGLAMPAYMLDLPGARGKIPVGPAYLEGEGPDYVATDPNGETRALFGFGLRRLGGGDGADRLGQRVLLRRARIAEERGRLVLAAERAIRLGAALLEQHLELVAGAILGLADVGQPVGLAVDGHRLQSRPPRPPGAT